ncbi:MAG: SIMPL domain-containing protein [Candidatus Micrarchaeota archaeon]|nr:SIMPL domain-containing protein [Candidatus Micrarchaeota archaeon]
MAQKTLAVDVTPMALAMVIAALLFSGAIYYSPSKTTFVQSQPDQQHMLSVSADANQEIAPDKVEIIFSVVSRGQDPATIQADNDAKLRQIKQGLLQLGVPDANIKTVGYSLDRYQEYNKTLENYEDRGYQLSNSLRVVSYDVSTAGAIVKSSVANGANEVSSVQFGLSDKLKDSTYNALLQTAASQAKGKAEAMAKAAGVSLSGLDSMNEGYSYVEPLANYNYKSMDASGSAPAPEVSISAGLVKVSASVSAAYGIAG